MFAARCPLVTARSTNILRYADSRLMRQADHLIRSVPTLLHERSMSPVLDLAPYAKELSRCCIPVLAVTSSSYSDLDLC